MSALERRLHTSPSIEFSGGSRRGGLNKARQSVTGEVERRICHSLSGESGGICTVEGSHDVIIPWTLNGNAV